MAAQVAEEYEELSCVLIPLAGMNLLLPNVSVAEILPWRRIRPNADGPDWLLGQLGWRGAVIPVVRYERMNGNKGNIPGAGRCLVVMNRARLANGPPFYALAAESLPRMLQLGDDDVTPQDAAPGAASLTTVTVGTESAVIPDLGYIEEALAAQLG